MGLEKPSRAAAWCPNDPAPWTTMKRVPEGEFSRKAAPTAAAAAASPFEQRVSSLDLSVMAAPPSLTMTSLGRVIAFFESALPISLSLSLSRDLTRCAEREEEEQAALSETTSAEYSSAKQRKEEANE